MKRFLMATVVAVVLSMTLASNHAEAQFSFRKDIDALFDYALNSRSEDTTLLYARKIDSLSSANNDLLGKAKSQILLGIYYLQKLQLDSANYELYQSELYFCKHPELKSTSYYAQMLLVRSMVSYNIGETEQSRKYGIKALQVARQLKAMDVEIEVLDKLAVLERLQNHPEEALYYFLQGYKLKSHRKVPDVERIDDFLFVANLYNSLQQYENAKGYIEKGLALQRKHGFEEKLAKSFNSIGTAYRGLKNYDSAMWYFEEARKLSLKRGDKVTAFEAENNIAIAQHAQGQYHASLERLDRILASYTEIPLIMKLTAMQYRAANLYKLKDYKNAVAAARALYALALDVEIKQPVIEAAGLLAQMYRATNRYDSAAFFLDAKIVYRDSLLNFNTQDKFSKIYAEFLSLEKQKEIDALEQQKALQLAENKLLWVSLISGSAILTLSTTALVLRYRNKQKKQKLMNYELQHQLEKSHQELEQQTLRMITINNGWNEVMEQLKRIKTETPSNQRDVQHALTMIQMHTSMMEHEWDVFDKFFGHTHANFLEKVESILPQLTIQEKRLLRLIRTGLTNREISNILGIEPRSVTMAKYRLKKRLGLAEDEDINTFVRNIDGKIDPENFDGHKTRA